MTKTACVFAAAALFLTACPLLDVEVEVPEVCVGYRDLPIEGVPSSPTTTVHKSFGVDDLSGFHQITDLDAEASFARAAIVAKSGITDFGFVEAATISIRSPDSELPPLVLYTCDGDCVPANGALDMTAAAQHDVLAYLRGDSLVVEVELRGALPEQAWSTDIDVCFSARARYQY